jgi:hypothetical protein
VFDEGGAALHPIAVVAVDNAVDVADLSGVNVAADDPVDPIGANIAGGSWRRPV